MRQFILPLFLLIPLTLPAQSLRLSSYGSWVNAGDLDISGNKITIEGFIFITGDLVTDTLDIVSKHVSPSDANYLLRPKSFEITTYRAGNSGATQFFALSHNFNYLKNRWYHVAATYDGAKMKYYINGCLQIEITATGNLFQNNFKTAIGHLADQKKEQFYGYIDELRIWNLARTEADIKDNMLNLATPSVLAGLKLYYKFNNNTTNLQGNTAFNGILQGNAAYIADVPTIKLPQLNGLTIQQPCNEIKGKLNINAPADMVFSLNQDTFSNQNQYNNLDTGKYKVRIKPHEWCFIKEDSFQLLDFKVKDISVKNALCSLPNGEILVKTTDDSNAQYSFDSLSFSPSTLLKNLKYQTYPLWIKHREGCVIRYNMTVKDSITLNNTLDIDIKNEKCGQKNGSILVSAMGKRTIEYSLDSLNFSIKNQFSNLPKGTYPIYVRNSDGCKTKGIATLQNDSISYLKIDKIDIKNTTCGLPNGIISIKINGNTEGVKYRLESGNFRENNMFLALNKGEYFIFVRDSHQCIIPQKAVVEASQKDSLIFDIKTTPSVCNGKTGTISIENIKNGVQPYQFALNDSSNLSNTLIFNGLGGDRYTLFAKDSSGCGISKREVFVPKVNCEIYIPSVFSPNNDGENDVFKIFANEGIVKTIKSYQIFNRWGNQVYTSPQINNDFSSFNTWWDGTFQGKFIQPDVYIYVIEVEYAEGLNKYRDKILKGDITVMR